jgi:GNAT superfamily N-acetyltransferase
MAIRPTAATSQTLEPAGRRRAQQRRLRRRRLTAIKRILARLGKPGRWAKSMDEVRSGCVRPNSCDRLDSFDANGREPPIDASAVLRDGTPVQLRTIRPDDKERLRIAFERLSARSVYRRFFHPVAALTPDMLKNLTELDCRDHVGLALCADGDAGERLIAVARFVRDPCCSERAEFAITVADDYQNRGAATLLFQELVRIARAGGVRELVADVLEDNREMLKLIRSSKLACRETSKYGACRAALSLVEH